jgi:hypothetical protein
MELRRRIAMKYFSRVNERLRICYSGLISYAVANASHDWYDGQGWQRSIARRIGRQAVA